MMKKILFLMALLASASVIARPGGGGMGGGPGFGGGMGGGFAGERSQFGRDTGLSRSDFGRDTAEAARNRTLTGEAQSGAARQLRNEREPVPPPSGSFIGDGAR